MQNISLQRSILYTILHFTLFYAIVTGCDYCKESIDKSTNIKIITPLTATPKEKPDPKETALDGSIEDSLEPSWNEEENEEIKKKIEEELVAEEQRLKEEEKKLNINCLQEEELVAEEQRLEEEEKKLNTNCLQENAYDRFSRIDPSAPEWRDIEPPPPYNNEWNSNFERSSRYNDPKPILSNECNKCCEGNNRPFDEEDIKNILENPSTKLKIIKFRLGIISKSKQNLKRWFKNKRYIHKFKEKKNKYENTKAELKEEQKTIFTNAALCSRHKVEQLEDNFIKLTQINYKIKDVDNIIAKIRKKKNNNPDTSEINPSPYPTQLYKEAPPQYGSSKLYPTLP